MVPARRGHEPPELFLSLPDLGGALAYLEMAGALDPLSWRRWWRARGMGEEDSKKLLRDLLQDGWVVPEDAFSASRGDARSCRFRVAPWTVREFRGAGALERARLKLDPEYREQRAREELTRAERMSKMAVVPGDRRRQSEQRAARGRHGRLEPVLQPW